MRKQARNASQQGRAKSSYNSDSPNWVIDMPSHTWTNPLMGARTAARASAHVAVPPRAAHAPARRRRALRAQRHRA
jgi:hypothetical protein